MPAQAPEGTQEIGRGVLIVWDKAKSVDGNFLGSSEVKSKFGKGPEKLQTKWAINLNKPYTYQTDEGPKTAAAGERAEFFAPAVLERKLLDANLAVGQRVVVVFENTTVQTKGGQTAKDFSVFVGPKPEVA